MDQVMAWAGFLGAWLLLAGPLYQGAIELREEEVDHEGMEASIAGLPRPEPPSAWWWLVPPVMYLIYRHRRSEFRRAAMALLTPAQRDQFSRFVSKAAGWFTVSAGGALLAIDQTWQVIDRHHWPAWLFWLLIVVMLSAAVLNTAYRMSRGGQQAGAAGQQAAPGSA